ncbi:MAG: hypothetical protein ACI3ZI_07350, partial [Candidatus Cryptobacteroides sp.]
LFNFRWQSLFKFGWQWTNIIMNYKKPIYETPDMKVFEMHTEGVMCLSNPEIDGLSDITGDDVQDDSDAWIIK